MDDSPDPLVEKFYALKPLEFSKLVRMSIYENPFLIDDPLMSIHVEFELAHKKEPRHLLVTFKGVSNFQFALKVGMVITQIDIVSIRDWGWEVAKYKVAEVEDGTFSLMCVDFEATIKVLS